MSSDGIRFRAQGICVLAFCSFLTVSRGPSGTTCSRDFTRTVRDLIHLEHPPNLSDTGRIPSEGIWREEQLAAVGESSAEHPKF